MNCPAVGCKSEVAPGTKYCPQCGTPIPQSPVEPPTSFQFGDIGMFKGSIDARVTRTEVGQQINVEGDYRVTQFSGPTTVIQRQDQGAEAQHLIDRGRSALQEGDLRTAADLLQTAISKGSPSPEARVLLAVCKLSSRSVNSFGSQEIQAVEQMLASSLSDSVWGDFANILLGLLKYDYYKAAGRAEGQPSVADLQDRAMSVILGSEQEHLLSGVLCSDRARNAMGL